MPKGIFRDEGVVNFHVMERKHTQAIITQEVQKPSAEAEGLVFRSIIGAGMQEVSDVALVILGIIRQHD